MTAPVPALYKQFFVDKADERVDLFRKIANQFDVTSALYPGSFVQISPSFVIPRVVYVDNDRRNGRFFVDPLLMDYVRSRKEYEAEPQIVAHPQSYETDIAEPPGSFDLLISQYAGFISPACKKYLRIGGVLLANDSHGDASMAYLDQGLEFIGVVNRRGDAFSIKDTGLDQYFVPKRDIVIDEASLREMSRAPAYTKWASSYLFRRVA
jgi:hypothetical protein